MRTPSSAVVTVQPSSVVVVGALVAGFVVAGASDVGVLLLDGDLVRDFEDDGEACEDDFGGFVVALGAGIGVGVNSPESRS